MLNGRAHIESLDECTILSEQGGGAYKMCQVKIEKIISFDFWTSMADGIFEKKDFAIFTWRQLP